MVRAFITNLKREVENIKKEEPQHAFACRGSRLVRVTGLEPVRRGHTPLKRACLPIPAHSQILGSLFK